MIVVLSISCIRHLLVFIWDRLIILNSTHSIRVYDDTVLTGEPEKNVPLLGVVVLEALEVEGSLVEFLTVRLDSLFLDTRTGPLA